MFFEIFVMGNCLHIFLNDMGFVEDEFVTYTAWAGKSKWNRNISLEPSII